MRLYNSCTGSRTKQLTICVNGNYVCLTVQVNLAYVCHCILTTIPIKRKVGETFVVVNEPVINETKEEI